MEKITFEQNNALFKQNLTRSEKILPMFWIEKSTNKIISTDLSRVHTFKTLISPILIIEPDYPPWRKNNSNLNYKHANDINQRFENRGINTFVIYEEKILKICYKTLTTNNLWVKADLLVVRTQLNGKTVTFYLNMNVWTSLKAFKANKSLGKRCKINTFLHRGVNKVTLNSKTFDAWYNKILNKTCA